MGVGLGGGEEFNYFAAMLQFDYLAAAHKVEEHCFSCNVLVGMET